MRAPLALAMLLSLHLLPAALSAQTAPDHQRQVLAVYSTRRDAQVALWDERARRIWEEGILTESADDGAAPGMVDYATGRFLEGRRISTLRGWFTDRPERVPHTYTLQARRPL